MGFSVFGAFVPSFVTAVIYIVWLLYAASRRSQFPRPARLLAWGAALHLLGVLGGAGLQTVFLQLATVSDVWLVIFGVTLFRIVTHLIAIVLITRAVFIDRVPWAHLVDADREFLPGKPSDRASDSNPYSQPK